jgi:hypothetical protein
LCTGNCDVCNGSGTSFSCAANEPDCAGACNTCGGGGTNFSCAVEGDGAAGSPSCTPYLCDGTNATCPATCAQNNDCVVTCIASACTNKSAAGGPCDTNDNFDCVSGSCTGTTCN